MEPKVPSSFVKGHTKQSKKIPYWLWFIIAKSLGIKLHANDRPMLAIILHAVTLFSGGGMLLTKIWFSGYDISSHMTETDILDGIVAIIMVGLFVTLGIYSQRLAHRLFEHPRILEMMRLHSKTIAKINAAILAMLVLAAFVVVLNLATINYSYWYFQPSPNQTMEDWYTNSTINPCQTVEIPLLICQFYYFTQLVFSAFFLLWNAMVGAALICVARTHTISIRRFVCQLEADAFLRDQKLREKLYNQGSKESKDSMMYSWDAAIPETSNKKMAPMEIQESDANILNDENVGETFDSQVQLELSADEHPDQIQNVDSSVQANNQQSIENGTSRKTSLRKRFLGRFRRLSDEHDDDSVHSSEDSLEPKTISDEELLHKYWKLVNSTRLTSNAFQRWMCFVTTTVLFWSAIRIVYWLSHSPSLYGVMSLILPLFILPLLASAYAEVNYQGIQVFQSIIPTVDRTALFRYLYGTPIQLNVYGYPVTYGTMGTVLAAILAAFSSRILLQEMNKVLN